MIEPNRKRRGRAHSLTWRRASRAWKRVGEMAEACVGEPLNPRLHAAAIGEIVEHFGAEVVEAYDVDTDQLVDGITDLSADQLDRAIREAVAEARRRVRDGRDEDGYLAGVLASVAALPTITPDTEPK